MTIDECRAQCLACHACGLREGCRQVVFSGGNEKAPLWLVGEAPGAVEDEQGIPFVGRSGLLLDQFLESAGLSREKSVYITNIVKCRPPQNRDPAPAERDTCLVWLRRQFVLLRYPENKQASFGDFIAVRDKAKELCPEIFK